MNVICLFDRGTAQDKLLAYEMERVLGEVKLVQASEVSTHPVSAAYAKYGHLLTHSQDLMLLVEGDGMPLYEHELWLLMSCVIPDYERGWVFRIATQFGTVFLSSKDLPLSSTELKIKDVVILGAPRERAAVPPNVTAFFLGSSSQYASKRLRELGVHQIDPDPAGFFQAHANIARLSPTEAFMVIDDDSENIVIPDMPVVIRHNMVFYARNPYNGLVYGHGGIKVFLRSAFRCEPPADHEDMTLYVSRDVGLEVRSEVCNEHHFALSDFDGFRSAFRECYKLQRAGDPESLGRLRVWTEYSYPPLYRWIQVGAKLGKDFAERSSNFPINCRKAIVDVYEHIRKGLR